MTLEKKQPYEYNFFENLAFCGKFHNCTDNNLENFFKNSSNAKSY